MKRVNVQEKEKARNEEAFEAHVEKRKITLV
jgi:hypothetical protein